MNEVPETTRAVHLDTCLDNLFAGAACSECPADSEAERLELMALVRVAEGLRQLASATPGPGPAQRRRIRRRLEAPRSIIRQIAYYRLPYLPPLWIRREAC